MCIRVNFMDFNVMSFADISIILKKTFLFLMSSKKKKLENRKKT